MNSSPTQKIAAQAPPSQTHRRNSSGSSYTSSSPPNTSNNNHTMPAADQDPLAALERNLLAHPTTHHYAHSHHHPHHQQQHAHTPTHLAPPSPAHASRSRTPSPAPSPAAQRCMAATNAWTPSLNRRQSWDGQAYRHAMMLQATGLACECHPDASPNDQVHHHHRHPSGGSARGIYEADRGFSEVVGSVQKV